MDITNDIETQEYASRFIRHALLQRDNAINAQAELAGLRRKLDVAGIDFHNVSIYDKTTGNAAQAAAKAIRDKNLAKEELAKLKAYIEDQAKRILDVTDQRISSFDWLIKDYERMKKSLNKSSIPVRRPNTKPWLITNLEEIGKGGLSLSEMIALDFDGVHDHSSMERRLNEIAKEGGAFKVAGKFIHFKYRESYPEYAALEANRVKSVTGEELKTLKTPFSVFEERAKAKLDMGTGKKSGWQDAYEKQTNTKHAAVEKWKTDGVPQSAMNSIFYLVPAQKTESIDWKNNPQLDVRFKELYYDHLSYDDITTQMALDFPEFSWNYNKVSSRVRVLGLAG